MLTILLISILKLRAVLNYEVKHAGTDQSQLYTTTIFLFWFAKHKFKIIFANTNNFSVIHALNSYNITLLMIKDYLLLLNDLGKRSNIFLTSQTGIIGKEGDSFSKEMTYLNFVDTNILQTFKNSHKKTQEETKIYPYNRLLPKIDYYKKFNITKECQKHIQCLNWIRRNYELFLNSFLPTVCSNTTSCRRGQCLVLLYGK